MVVVAHEGMSVELDDHRLRRNGPLERGGNTEVFDEDVLGLHTSLSDEGLHKRASQAERYLERRV